jgi:hypothetical protein
MQCALIIIIIIYCFCFVLFFIFIFCACIVRENAPFLNNSKSPPYVSLVSLCN